MDTVKSTKRVFIVGVALDIFYMNISTNLAGQGRHLPLFCKAGPARSAPVPVVSMIRFPIGRRQAYRILISRMGKRKKIAENCNNLRTSNTDGALIDEIGKFDIHDDNDFVNGITVGNDHDRSFSSSEGPMDDCSAKIARIPFPGEFLQ